jgi:hypothetical protein
VAERTLHLTDDELWRAIADNTNALSALIEKECEWNAELDAPAIVGTLHSISICRADKYYREYRDYIAEVRRRYPSIWSKCATAK